MEKICHVVTEILAIKCVECKTDLEVDKRRTNEKTYKQPNGQSLNVYIPEILCMPYVLLKPFQKEKI